MRRAMMIMVSLVLLLSWGGSATGAILPDITNWGGDFLLSIIQSKVNGKVTAKELSGNPISGVVFKDLAITKQDPSLCKQIGDANILQTCQNRITENIIENQ